MRIVLDLRGTQTTIDFRRIDRFSMSLAKAMSQVLADHCALASRRASAAHGCSLGTWFGQGSLTLSRQTSKPMVLGAMRSDLRHPPIKALELGLLPHRPASQRTCVSRPLASTSSNFHPRPNPCPKSTPLPKHRAASPQRQCPPRQHGFMP